MPVPQAAEVGERGLESSSPVTYILLGFGGVALLRRRLHHLQHALHHGRPADAWVAQAVVEPSEDGSARCSVRSSSKGSWSGFVAGIVGLVLGVGLAEEMTRSSSPSGSTCRRPGRSSPPGRSSVDLLVGTLVTVLASIVPALRATRVPPRSLAVRDGWTLPKSPRTLALDSIHGAGTDRRRDRRSQRRALRRRPGDAECLLLLGLGVLGLFVGIALLASRLVKPLASLVGFPAGPGRLPGPPRRENALRNPGRGATAAALMIGLALVRRRRARRGPARLDRDRRSRSRSTTDFAVTPRTAASSPAPPTRPSLRRAAWSPLRRALDPAAAGDESP